MSSNERRTAHWKVIALMIVVSFIWSYFNG